MTAEKAIKRIKESRDYKYTHYGFVDSDGEAFDMAIEALEKQIPKKPLDKIMYKECPVCGAVDFGQYCMECGQKLMLE